jgi:hypothetical protein
MLPLAASGLDGSASAFQLCLENNKSDTWSIQVRHERGTDKTRPCLYIVFTNHGDFSLQNFVAGAETRLPFGKPIPCRLVSRKRDINGEGPVNVYGELQERCKGPFGKVCEQLRDQRDRDFLQRILNGMCHWERFMKDCREWESSAEANACREAMNDRRRKPSRKRNVVSLASEELVNGA